MNIHFISGLPRSGSTLLAAILNQNPDFRAGIISPIAPIVSHLLGRMSLKHETSIFITDEQRRRLVRAVFDVFYPELPSEGKTNRYPELGFVGPSDQLVFDSNRAWCAKLPLLTGLFPDCKVIACVREVPWIFDSIERFTQRNRYQPSALFNFSAEGTVYSRCEQLAAPDGMVGFALNALRTACFGGYGSHLMLLRYESLTQKPEFAMNEVYRFIDARPFKHDFTDIRIDATAFDNHIGAPGLHAVRPIMEPWIWGHDPILPPDLWQRYVNLSFWEDEHPMPGVLII